MYGTCELGGKDGVRRKHEKVKHGKVEVKRKWWVLAQPLYSPQGSHPGWP